MSTFPMYRKGKVSKVVVKFIGLKEGYVVDAGSATYKVGSLHADWNPYTSDCWEPYDYENSPQATKEITPETMELFFTLRLSGASSSTLTKVPNGYVMTSHSGHQIFIKENTKEIL